MSATKQRKSATLSNIPDDVFKTHIMPSVCANESLRLEVARLQARVSRLEESTEAFCDIRKYMCYTFNMYSNGLHRNLSDLEVLGWGIDSYSFSSVYNGERTESTVWKLVEEKIPTQCLACLEDGSTCGCDVIMVERLLTS